MPRSEDDWEEGEPVTSMNEMILQLLEENPSKAYSDREILAEFSGINEDNRLAITVAIQFYRAVLEDLVSNGKVEERQFEEEDEEGETIVVSYYRVKEDSD